VPQAAVSNGSYTDRYSITLSTRPRTVPIQRSTARCPAFSRVFPKNRCERADSGILSRTKNFFLQKRPSHKATPFMGQNHFWTGFWERGHD